MQSRDETRPALAGLAGASAIPGIWIWSASMSAAGGPQGAPILFLGILEKAYLIAVVVVAAATTVLAWRAAGRRRRRERVAPATARALLALGATLFSFLAAEAAAGAWLAWVHRAPSLPTTFDAAGASPSLPTKFDAAPTGELNVVVIGESSAEGVPYQKWLSIGEIVGWRLREVFPGRKVRVDVLAKSGTRLEHMHQKLATLTRRPDVLIVYAGHNEFYARHSWTHEVSPYYLDDAPAAPLVSVGKLFARVSPLVRLIEETLEERKVAAAPQPKGRRLIDAPSHSVEESAELLADFRRRLEAIVAYGEQVGATPVLVAPPGNDAGYEPDRSVLPPGTPRARREVFAKAFEEARRLEASDPPQSTAAYRGLVARYPGFAESHYRLAVRLEAEGQWAEAYEHYVAARDLDGHPMRCLTSFQDAYREIAARRHAILVDGQALFHARSPTGLLDDGLFNDGFHPSFEGHVALAEAVLAGLKGRRALGWPDSIPAPTIDLAECAAHFGVDAETWKAVCNNSVGFYHLTSSLRYDPAGRIAKRDRYHAALLELREGKKAEDLGVPGVGLRPVRDRAPKPASAEP